MKAFVCDACGKTIINPYQQYVKQFYVSRFTKKNGDPKYCICRKKIHLCDDCFRGLYLISEKEETKIE